MNIQNNLFFASIMFVIALATSGIAFAQEEPGMSNQQNCEKEAKDAGIVEEEEVQEYVEQCLAEMNAQKGAAESEAGG